VGPGGEEEMKLAGANTDIAMRSIGRI